MPAKKLKQLLDEHNIKYVTISHSPAYTAQETAQSAHISGKALAKTVVVKIDGEMAMVVLPAANHVHFYDLQAELGVGNVELANEMEFREKFPDCDPGTMPPFGNLYGMKVYLTEDLSREDEMAFNAGSYSELIQIKVTDFIDLVQPTTIKVA
ncbi:MAG: deacylase [Legionellales bacterium]|nr:deacylase [Legionellales bacterium]|tara:strand:- start:94196 stop:94654 length:459 start_codon:yes stop_codon:yes gene_type:complete